MQGKFIVLEGLEGAGKSSAIKTIESELTAQGVNYIRVREPGGTPLAESLRALVKSVHEENVAPETELLIMYAARAQLVHNVIKPALAKGHWVIADRHDWSSQAYQGGGRGIETEKLAALADIVLKGLTPSLVLYLDIDPAVGLTRAKGRGELDRIELESLSFFQRARERYLSLVDTHDFAVKIDAGQSMEHVHQDVLATIKRFLA
ncbi:Thymidylate kinase [Pseudoalteromonas luteoviolacea B = ATCC 29581]|nr:Thymidylate kinase [Pseudoalteromonas luteoviolacea B = ATCC 29581]